MEAIKTAVKGAVEQMRPSYEVHATEIGQEMQGGLAGKWRIGRLIDKALSDATCEVNKLYAVLEKRYGKGGERTTLQALRAVYVFFPSHSVDGHGQDVPIFAVVPDDGIPIYTGDITVYTALARSVALKSESVRLKWASFGAGRQAQEVKASLRWGVKHGVQDTPETAHTGRCAEEATERAQRDKIAKDKEEEERTAAQNNLLARQAIQERAAQDQASRDAEATEAHREASYHEAWDAIIASTVTPLDVLRALQSPSDVMETAQSGVYSPAVQYAKGIIMAMDEREQGLLESASIISKLNLDAQQGAAMLDRWASVAMVIVRGLTGNDCSGWDIDAYEMYAHSLTEESKVDSKGKGKGKGKGKAILHADANGIIDQAQRSLAAAG